MQNCTWNFDPEHGTLLQLNKSSSVSYSVVSILLPDYPLISRFFCVKNTSGSPSYCKSIGILFYTPDKFAKTEGFWHFAGSLKTKDNIDLQI